MSFLKKLKQMIVGEAKQADKIKVVEVSPKKTHFDKNTQKSKQVSKPSVHKEKETAGQKPEKPFKKDDNNEYPRKSVGDRSKPATSASGDRNDRFGRGDRSKPATSESGDRNDRFGRSDRSKPATSESGERSDRFGRSDRSKPATSESGERGSDRFGRSDRSKPSFSESGDRGSDRFGRGDKRKRRPRRSDESSVSSLNPDNEERNFSAWSPDEFIVEEAEGKVRFHDLELPESVMRGIFDAGYLYCTPIQGLILPEACKASDVSGKAQTGTGKTAAFLVTIFKRLLENAPATREKGTPRALIMAPTRELVIQIEKDARMIGKYTRLAIQSVFGGINYERQRRQVEDRCIDILVATPGRLLDYQEQGVLNLSSVEILVIDEADRMLDMGFIPDMKRIVSSTPAKGVRQTMLFSATLTPEILRLASAWTKNAISFEVESKEITAEAIEQRAYIVTDREKFPLIYNMIMKENLSRVIIFGNRRSEVSRLADLFKVADVSCGVLSGDVSQAKRIRTLEDLRGGKIKVLCATDVAARGLHVDDISHVFNYSLPDDPEDYVHRIGRTGRAGASGVSILFATEEDAYVIPRIEQFTGHKLIYINPEDELVTLPPELAQKIPARQLSFGSSRTRGMPRSGGGGGGRPGGRRPSSGSSSSSSSKPPFRGPRRGGR